MTEARKKKIAILGGGMGALSTAYELTRTPELRARHDVTVYSLGWRLGGKLASGKTRGEVERNEEHGLHVWLGFYENAFMTIRGVYDQLAPDGDEAFQTWSDAFKGQSFTPIGEQYGTHWTYWGVDWPENADIPGSGRVLLTPWGAITEVLSMMQRLLEGLLGHEAAEFQKSALAERHPIASWVTNLAKDVAAVGAVEAASVSGLLDMALRWAHAFEGDHKKHPSTHHEGIAEVLERFIKVTAQLFTGSETHPALRGIFHVLVIMTAMIRGLLDPKNGLFESEDLTDLDRYELRDFLKKYTIFDKVIERADELRAFYDLAFAYENGRLDRPNIAAGTAIRVIIRIVATAKGYVLYLPQAGFGEAVIAPMYRVLRQNGVKFELFHRVTRLELSKDRARIRRVHFAKQAKIKDGEPYRPMAYAPPGEGHGGMWYWPEEPFWDQLEDGEALRAAGVNFESKWRQPDKTYPVVIEEGDQFDDVVLAIAHGAFMELNSEPTLADELYAANPAFKHAIQRLGIVPTQAIQLWTKPDLAGLGWNDPKPAMVAAPEILDVWADMSQTLPYEKWPGDRPKFVAYVCAIYPTDLYRAPSTERDVPDRARAEVLKTGIDYYAKYTGWMWPKATRPDDPAALDYDVLVAPKGGTGVTRFEQQYFRANVDPTECCVSTLTGATDARLDADGSGFENLYLAGDWIHTVTDTVCVESATSAGKMASRAICGSPRDIPGEHFFFGKERKKRVAERAGGRGSSANTGHEGSSERRPAASLPLYVSFHGHAEQSAMPPGKVKNGRCYYFGFPCDPTATQRFIDSHLNAPAGGAVRYHLLGNRALISFLRSDKLFSTGQVTGYVEDLECGVWVPMVVQQANADPSYRLALWMPYVFINNSAGMCTGREVWGFRKEIATFTIPMDPSDATTFVANATLFKTFAPETHGQLEPLVRIHRSEKKGIEEGAWQGATEAFEAIAHALTDGTGHLKVHGLEEDIELLLELEELVLERNVPVANLKQFRDAEDPTRACYQALVESPIHLDALHGGWFLDGHYSLSITDCASHRIAQDLGLKTSSGLPLDVAFYVDFDFSAKAGKVVWEAR